MKPIPTQAGVPILRRRIALWVCLGGMLVSCSSASSPEDEILLPSAPPPTPYAAAEALKAFDASQNEPYRIGQGDVLTVQVWDRVELSGPVTVGPDGAITLPVSGSIQVAGSTREEAAKVASDALSRYYANPTVTIRVDQYVSNHVTVLGRVLRPGLVPFEKPPTLLDALSRAGGLSTSTAAPPVGGGPSRSPLTHCAVVRGRDRVAWIDLRRLTDDGDLSLNLRLQAHDLVFVPDWEDTPVYVLGQVLRPGPLRWAPGMTYLDAIAQAGGPARDAWPGEILLVRPSQNLRVTLPFRDLIEPVPGANVALQRGDLIYVPTNFLADIGYVLEKINPFGWVFLARGAR